MNVQIQFEGDPASALVSFSSAAEAEAAFTSSEAVLGNRFIKMFYHYPPPPSSRGGFHSRATVKDRLGGKAEGGEGVGTEQVMRFYLESHYVQYNAASFVLIGQIRG